MRRALVVLVVTILAGGLGAACTRDSGEAPTGDDEIPQPTVSARGDAISVRVAPTEPVNVPIPGVGHVTGAPGAFATAGTMLISRLGSNEPTNDILVTSSVGLDVRFEGTSLVKPLTIVFDDTEAMRLVPPDAAPIVLHRPQAGAWEVRPLARTKN